MSWIVEHYQIVLVISGLLTLTMLQFVISPGRAMRSTYGEALEGPLADVIVRGWGLLIGLTGGMLIWAAYHPETRDLAVGAAVISKVFYMGSLLAKGGRFIKGFSGVTVLIDVAMVLLLIAGQFL
ncbi:hypothetical protein CSW58_12350 [Caulobacter sp. B11]|uniref:hypothetical protein n=1 Tax=Caulobacter sp. B11 TaxID=2048899 RepID=UPI000C12A21D|nr:hypothetical protein [Caulobacter sp. B11]PHY12477.1 hypothetical protein CSW58_12350 [Caulobacter sp. B11]